MGLALEVERRVAFYIRRIPCRLYWPECFNKSDYLLRCVSYKSIILPTSQVILPNLLILLVRANGHNL